MFTFNTSNLNLLDIITGEARTEAGSEGGRPAWIRGEVDVHQEVQLWASARSVLKHSIWAKMGPDHGIVEPFHGILRSNINNDSGV